MFVIQEIKRVARIKNSRNRKKGQNRDRIK